jgi:hypothetical protein
MSIVTNEGPTRLLIGFLKTLIFTQEPEISSRTPETSNVNYRGMIHYFSDLSATQFYNLQFQQIYAQLATFRSNLLRGHKYTHIMPGQAGAKSKNL